MPDRSMLVLYPASAAVSSVVNLCFIYELVKSTKLAFSRNTLLSVPSRNPRSETLHSLGIPVQRTPPCLQNSSSKKPPMPSEFRKAVRRWVRIFSGIAHSQLWHLTIGKNYHKISKISAFLLSQEKLNSKTIYYRNKFNV